MKITPLNISDILVIEPHIYQDNRGFFYESFNLNKFQEIIGKKINFVQDNHSKSTKGVLRGLHYQLTPKAQSKLVRVIQGEIYDVVVDLRKNSKSFGQWIGEKLSAENKKQLWIPEGFAHGFITITETSEVLYKVTEFYSAEHEQSLIWNDPEININWPFSQKLIISEKDLNGKSFSELTSF